MRRELFGVPPECPTIVWAAVILALRVGVLFTPSHIVNCELQVI